MVSTSVIMSIYNGEQFLSDAILSVLNQTFTDFEFIIINDGSTDNSLKIAQSFSQQDRRIKLFDRKHSGLANALNFALAKCNGKYIAHIDADDVWLPEKLDLQINFLNNHPDISIIGSSIIFINKEGREIRKVGFNKQEFYDNQRIRKEIVKRNLFCHSSVVFRKYVLESSGNYDPNFEVSLDYDLWSRILSNAKGVILKMPLVKYRTHNNMLSTTHRKLLIRESYAVRKQIIRGLALSRTWHLRILYDIMKMWITFYYQRLLSHVLPD